MRKIRRRTPSYTGLGRRLALSTVAGFVVIRMAACDSPTEVGIAAVRLTPDSAAVLAGDETRLNATVVDDDGEEVRDAVLEWSSTDPAVATVDGQGMVQGNAPGTARISAKVAGASGSAVIHVLPPPSIAVSQSVVAMAVGAGGPPPEPRTVSVSNGGAGSVGQLAVRVLHPAGSPTWLGAELADTGAPTTLSLTVATEGLTPGEHTATVEITSSEAGVSPIEVAAALTLTDLEVQVTDGGTELSEAGGTDQVLVSLSAAPSENVVLDVTGDDTVLTVSPARLTFTPDGWDEPQVVTVTGVDNPAVDGVRESTLSLAVDTAASDAAFDGVASRAVSVTITDDDVAGVALSATGGYTRVDETGSTDEVHVVLLAQPLTDVHVIVEIDDRSEVTVAPARLTFTSADWSTPKAITLTGVDDSLADGPRESTLTVSVDEQSSDAGFGSVRPETLTVVTADDEAVGVSAATPTSHPDVSADRLVASYDLTTLTAEGLLRDFSGRDLHGVISGTTVVTAPRGGGRLFEAAPRDRIELPPRSDFDLDGPLSIVARIRMDRQRQHQHVIACDDKFALTIREADQVRLSNTRGDLAETLEPLSPDVWHSVIAVFRGTVGDVLGDSNIEIWIDGVRAPIAVRNPSGTTPVVWRDGVLYPSDACYLGFESHQGEPGHQRLPFYGAIDEMIVFGRALTPEEIQLLAVSP